jgi:membrane protease YdiL (CAAX protease family)
VSRHPLAAFFIVAFALTWVTVPMGSFMAAGPLIAALAVLGIVEGPAGIRNLGRRMIQWRVGWHWYAAAVLVPLSVAFAAGGVNVVFGASDAAIARLEASAILLAFALHMVVPVFAPLGEEPGWRGFALPRLQAAHSPLVATLILGVIVALWHAPLMLITTEHFDPAMLLGTVGVNFFYTWLFNHTGGSVFMTMVAHAADGAVAGTLLANQGGFHGNDGSRYALLYSAAWCVVALTLVLFDRRSWRTAPHGAFEVPSRQLASTADDPDRDHVAAT